MTGSKFCCAVSLALTLAASAAVAEEAQTLKERLSDKASDAQRVDNCRVPPERRGPLPRPDCPDQLQLPMPAAKLGTSGPSPLSR
jgi:hypothetical protein